MIMLVKNHDTSRIIVTYPVVFFATSDLILLPYMIHKTQIKVLYVSVQNLSEGHLEPKTKPLRERELLLWP